MPLHHIQLQLASEVSQALTQPVLTLSNGNPSSHATALELQPLMGRMNEPMQG
jgi:hypothetical protein